MSYQIIIEKPAMKFLLKQSQEVRVRILRAVNLLPGQGDIKPMSGHANLFRLRVGTYRVLYTIDEAVVTVRVIAIGNRGDIYK